MVLALFFGDERHNYGASYIGWDKASLQGYPCAGTDQTVIGRGGHMS